VTKFLETFLGPSWRTSLLGYVGAALLEVALALDTLPASQWKGWHIVAVFVAALARAMKDAAVTGGTVPATPEATGRVRAGSDGIAPLLVLVSLLGAGPAFAGEPATAADPTAANGDPGAIIADAVANAAPDARRFGGCFRGGAICAGPSVNLSLLAYDLKRETFRAGFMPGAGYGLTLWANRWHSVGISGNAFVAFSSAGVDSATLSGIVSFAEYVRVGYGLEVVGARDGVSSSRSRYLLLGIGADFGK
jgi:hypothetical protein